MDRIDDGICEVSDPNLPAGRLFTPWRLGVMAVFVLSAVIYFPSLMGAPVWDDDILLSANGAASESVAMALNSPFLGNYYRPLTTLSFVADNVFAKGLPFFFHQTNILIHAVTAVLVCALGFQLTGSRRAGILSGAFFAVQPLQLGAVAWIGGRTDALSALFLCLFLLALVRYHVTRRISWVVLSCTAYVLAAFTKEQSAAILLVVPASVFAIGTHTWRDAWRLSLPFLGCGVAFGFCFLMYRPPGELTPGIGFGQHTAIFLTTVWHYSLAIFAPSPGFTATYTLQNYGRWALVSAGFLALAGWVLLTRAAWRSSRPQALMILGAIAVSLPVLNLVLIPSLWVGPYRIATAGPAIAVCLGSLLSWSLAHRRHVVAGLLAVNLFLGATVTWSRSSAWHSGLRYFSSVVAQDPCFVWGRYFYTEALLSAGKPRSALLSSDDALGYVFGKSDWASALSAATATGMSPLTRLRLIEGVDVVPDMKVIAFLLWQRSRIHQATHDGDLALTELWEAHRCDPRDPDVSFALGKRLQDGNPILARQLVQYAYRQKPGSHMYALGLAKLDIALGDYASAEPLLRVVLRGYGWEGYPWILLARVLMHRGDLEGARNALDTAATKVNLSKFELDAQYARLRKLSAANRNGRAGRGSHVR